MSKLPKEFIRQLHLLDIFTPYKLWVETFSEIELIRDKDEKITFLKEQEKVARNDFKNKGGSLWVEMKVLGKIKSDADQSYEDQLIDYFSQYEFRKEELAIINPVVYKVSDICNFPISRPMGIVDAEIIKELKAIANIPVVKDFIELLSFLKHLDRINNKIRLFQDKNSDANDVPESNETKQNIKAIFGQMGNRKRMGWRYAFIDEKGYNSICNYLTLFLENENYKIPDDVEIKVYGTCQTQLGRRLNEIYNLVPQNRELKHNQRFFKLLRVINMFKNYTDDKIYNILQR